MMIMAVQYWFFQAYNMISKPFFQYDIWHERNMLKAIIVTIITCMFISVGAYLFKCVARRNRGLQKLGKLIGIR